jgi:hypothetical protein
VLVAPAQAHGAGQLSNPALQHAPHGECGHCEEALQGGPRVTEYAVLNKTHRSSTKTGLTVKLPTDLDSRTTDPNLTSYAVELKTKVLTRGGKSYTCFDQAKAVRE